MRRFIGWVMKSFIMLMICSSTAMAWIEGVPVILKTPERIELDVDLTFNPVKGDVIAAGVGQGLQSAQNAGGAGLPGLVAALLTAQVMKQSQSSMAESRVLVPVKPLAEWLRKQDGAIFWRSYLSKAMELPQDKILSGNVKTGIAGTKRVAPSVHMTGDYRSIVVRLAVDDLDAKGKTASTEIYEWFSKPISGGATEPASVWSENDMGAFRSAAEEGVTALFAMRDLKAVPVGGSGPIRYSNGSGQFYERGKIVSQSGNRLIFRTLSGSLKSVAYDQLN